MKQNNLIDHWSYSAMASLLNNPMAFKKTYILKQYDNLTSPTALVGNAGHKALEMYYNGLSEEAAIEQGLKVINEKSDVGINYGKTGSREKILNAYTQAINFAFAELPDFHEVLGVEESHTAEIESMDGGVMGLPAKAKMDIVARNKDGEIEIHDWKFVGSYTDPDVDDFKKWLQGMFNYYVVKAKYGEAPARIVYQEIKIAKNKDNTPQRQPYVYEFNSVGDRATFEKLYNECTAQISLPGYQFLPNPSDIFDGQITFELYRSGVMGVEAPVAVPHKTEQVQFADKKFVPSAVDQIENVNLTPEEKIRLKLQEFGVSVEMQETHVGASVTQFTMKPARGVPMSKIARMGNDLALALGSESIRIEAPIRGTSLVGVEIPSTSRKTIELADRHFVKNTLQIPIGQDVFGNIVHKDLAEMPHLLIAGQTGSGKSVMINVLLTAITKQMAADKLELILIDPKRVELAGFANLPHLAMPVVYDNEEAMEVLDHAVDLMEKRYAALEKEGVRNIDEYVKLKDKYMTKMVIVIDEFSDLMLNGGTEKRVTKVIDGYGPRGGEISHNEEKPSTETQIIRLAQKARAVGIHLVLATQRPSADVVTGLIKANIPAKIAFSTTSKTNSLIILDKAGAEELTGKGDMLFLDPSAKDLKRLQGLYA